jgi:hypothetical protein
MRLAMVFALSVALFHCVAPAETSVAPPVGNPCAKPCTPDGGADCTCFFNADCSDGFRCGATGNGTCECAARGVAKYDAPCKGPDDCASAVCVDVGDAGMFCSQACDPAGPEACTGHFKRCFNIAEVGGVCLP